MSSDQAARVAIVGTGGIANAHATALASLGDAVTLVGAIDVDPTRVEEFGSRWNVPVRSADLAGVLEGEGIDVVHVCTPPNSHAELAALALRAGVTPIIEKPPTMSLAQLDELIDVERRSTASGVCVFQHRFGSGAVRLRELAESGALGRPLVGAADTYWFRDDAYFDVPWRGSWEAEGGGPTMGHGIHQFDLLFSVLGPWSEVTAITGRQARNTETEDVSMALVRFDNGAMATVVNSVVSPRETSVLRFDFERASVEVVHVYGYRDADWRLTAAPGVDDLATAWPGDRPDTPSGHLAQFEAVYAALARGEQAEVSFAHARDTEEFIAALYASAFEHRTVVKGELDASSPYAQRMGGDNAAESVLAAGRR